MHFVNRMILNHIRLSNHMYLFDLFYSATYVNNYFGVFCKSHDWKSHAIFKTPVQYFCFKSTCFVWFLINFILKRNSSVFGKSKSI